MVVVVVECLSLSMSVYLCCSFVVRPVVLCIDVLCVSVMDEVNKILLLWRWMSSFELWQMSGVGTSGS